MDTGEEPRPIEGVLRAVHLDKNWLEIVTNEPVREHIRIDEAGDALDDVVGPMVNRNVVVTAVRRGKKYFYNDIELVESGGRSQAKPEVWTVRAMRLY